MCLAVTAATNKQHSASKDTAKLDRETEELHRKSASPHRCLLHSSSSSSPDEKVTLSFSRALQQARVAKSWSQKDLATVSFSLSSPSHSHSPPPPPPPSHTHTHTHTQRINEKPQVVNEYESGKAIPNQQIISKLERALGVKLRGKDIGAPLGPKKK